MLNRGRLPPLRSAIRRSYRWPAHPAGDGGSRRRPCRATSGRHRARRMSVANRVVSVGCSRETASRPGRRVWLNASGAIVRDVRDHAACRESVTISRSPRGLPPARSLAGDLLCQTSGIFPYHVVIATPDSEIALHGVVVVGQ
jgi:hypothetical protein